MNKILEWQKNNRNLQHLQTFRSKLRKIISQKETNLCGSPKKDCFMMKTILLCLISIQKKHILNSWKCNNIQHINLGIKDHNNQKKKKGK